MSDRTGQVIKKWVAEGGFLFAGLWCGAKDEFGFGQYVVPGFGLDEVFGAKEVKLTPIFSDQDKKITNMFGSFGVQITGRPLFRVVAPLTPGGQVQPGDTFTGFRYVSSLKAIGSEVIALDECGDIVAVRNRYGNGQAIMIGTFPIRENQFAEDGLTRMVDDFTSLAGIERPAILINRSGHEVEAKILDGQGKTGLLVLLNAEKASFDFNVCLNGRVLKSAVNLETGSPVHFQVENGNTFVRLALLEGDAAGIFIEEL